MLALPLAEASVKVRSGPPKDEPEDYDSGIWAGVLPAALTFGPAEPDPALTAGVPVPEPHRPAGRPRGLAERRSAAHRRTGRARSSRVE